MRDDIAVERLFDIGQAAMRFAPIFYILAVLIIIFSVYSIFHVQPKSQYDTVFALVKLGIVTYLLILATAF